jgi:hypothetical protein
VQGLARPRGLKASEKADGFRSQSQEDLIMKRIVLLAFTGSSFSPGYCGFLHIECGADHL